MPSRKKRKGFQQDIRIFVKQGVYQIVNSKTNEFDSRNIAHKETRPPSKDRTRKVRVGIAEHEQSQGVAIVDCEYSNNIAVGAPSKQPGVTIPQKMRF